MATDLVLHLYTRKSIGRTIIVADQPFSFMRVTRKQWLQLGRRLQRERARSLQPKRLNSLIEHIQRVDSLAFTMQTMKDQPDANVFVMEA